MINRSYEIVMNYNPRISILTPSYNQGAYIEENILSVLRQDYPNYEHIIIDGGSTDNTIPILKNYPHLKWISEQDKGQADALNKGILMATGDIIGWINSDDYYEKNALHEVAAIFDNLEIQWVIGNVTNRYSDTGEFVPRKSPQVTYHALIKNPDIVRQQAAFFRKSAIEMIGGWNTGFYMVMDYDLWLRMARFYEPVMINKNWAYYRIHGDQKSSFVNIIRQFREIDHILKKEKLPLPLRLRMKVKKRIYFLKALIKQFLIHKGWLDKKYSLRSVRMDTD